MSGLFALDCYWCSRPIAARCPLGLRRCAECAARHSREDAAAAAGISGVDSAREYRARVSGSLANELACAQWEPSYHADREVARLKIQLDHADSVLEREEVPAPGLTTRVIGDVPGANTVGAGNVVGVGPARDVR